MSWLYSIVFAGLLFSSDNPQSVLSSQQSVTRDFAVATVVGDETEKFEQSYPLSKNGNVSVSNVNGSIVVEAWDKEEVRLEAVKTADSKETLADVEIKISSTADSFSVEADYKGWKWNDKRGNENRNRRLDVEFRLSVPRTAVLNEIETVNGSVTVSNFINVTKISAVNGNVTASNLRGAANLSTVNGQVAADFDRVEATSKINLSTVNGQVNLVLPSDVSATIKAESLNGTITNDFGLTVRKGQYVGRDLYGRIGGGEGQIKLSSVNGGLSISRKNDGRSVGPATNLLPSKKADDDWDDNNEKGRAAANAAHVDREVARAVRESERSTAQSMREAQRAIEAAGPSMETMKMEGFKNLEKFKIDGHKLKTNIKEGLKEQQDSQDRIRRDIEFEKSPTIEKKSNSFNVKGTPKVSVETRGCSVIVRGWEKAEVVKYVVTEVDGRRAGSTSVAQTNDSSSVTLKVVNSGEDEPGIAGDQMKPERVRVEVFVPRKANLKIVSDSEIRLDGVSGNIELKGGDESINVRDVDGILSLSASEGLVRVIGFTGDLSSQTECGDVFLEGNFNKLSSKATDGTVTLTVPTDANATFTSNTDVESDGVNVVQENDHTWRLGKGGSKYNFDFNDGKLVVRSSATVSPY